MSRRAATHLMFTGNAADALELYAAVFPGFRLTATPGRAGTVTVGLSTRF